MPQISKRIVEMRTVDALDGFTDVVVSAVYSITATEGGVSVSLPMEVTFDRPGAGFTPFKQLNEAVVINWAEAGFGAAGVNALTQRANEILAERLKPVPEVVALPWA